MARIKQGQVCIYMVLTSCFLISLFSNPKLSHPAIEESDDSVLVRTTSGRPIFKYLKAPSEKAKENTIYSRSGYIHPLFSPSGKEITGDYAADHPHQHGLFFAWTKSTFRGKPTDFWNQKLRRGDIRFHSFIGKNEEPSRFSLEFEHVFTIGKNSNDPILKERWLIRIPKKKLSHNQFDLISTQTCATEDPLLIQKYHYGGMAIRGNSQWLELDADEKPIGKMITSEGKNRNNGNHSRPRWVAMYGPIDGESCGVVLMNHPDNARFPQWVRLHPSKPYFCFAQMVDRPFAIRPGQPYVSKFRFLTFDGEPEAKLIEKVWQEWIEDY